MQAGRPGDPSPILAGRFGVFTRKLPTAGRKAVAAR